MKVGDFVQWSDQTNYRGLCGIVTKIGVITPGMKLRREPPDIFVHWTEFAPDHYQVGAGWEKVKDVELLSTGDIK